MEANLCFLLDEENKESRSPHVHLTLLQKETMCVTEWIVPDLLALRIAIL